MQDAPVDDSTRPITRHSWRSTQLLKQWYTSNSAWPYPSAEQKKELSHQTGLSVRQISQWFVNTRRRDAERQGNEILDSSINPVSSSVPTSLDLNEEQQDNVKAIDRRHRSSSSGAISQVTVQGDLAGLVSRDDVPVNASALSSSCSSSYSHGSDRTSRHHRKTRCVALRHTARDEPAEENDSRIYQCTFCRHLQIKIRLDETRGDTPSSS
ncbi:uncharacterized protein TRIVIDRAFT_51881 [Trichoderma virens Gv29-8]|uniref:Homeobox domain-containing protein n=1 Tax=Hypocrea virens (strain Gv29-8 / FGSC 10586) TaxID=413071 RepID=G9MWM3_HYPVG|nr:uncharacterized protein TRIVIDRAFT_51881 [Trichoderma virens Gv29-8]EHK21190.1 hypothetical protein TRIVIDRAFT_51881 [Trichoderma virens Gv29-8]